MPRTRLRPANGRLLAGYRPLPGVPDELVDANGAMRPAWAGLIDHLEACQPEALAQHFARAQQYLRDAGVFFRSYGQHSLGERDWPFSPLPIVLPETEWQHISAGLVQRADLLEAVVRDLYGPGRLVADGLIPAALVAENPEWLRPMVGVQPRSGNYLHFLAFEIGRGPDGRWWVLGDRAQAPSGAGFALENRVASIRAFGDHYRGANVHRLAGFFRSFRDALEGLRGTGTARAGGKVGILTPGPMTDTYYEHAYIARYLGLTLLEGGDLTVEDGALNVRTVSGPVPVDVLWRRLDANWADPVELAESSQIGTPGLISAIRAGTVSMVNALGAGVLETQALMAFLPGISQALNGVPLTLPNIATWWCGQQAERDHVRAQAHRMLIGPALATRLPFETDGAYALKGQLRGVDDTLDGWLAQNGAGLVGQELVTLSTTPVYENGTLVPRPMSLRVFLARTPQGWQVMPGGFARIGTSADTTAIAMQQGSAVADVWILGSGPVKDDTMFAPPKGGFARAEAPALPSRAADNLFWLGRYVERTEGLLRLTRAYSGRFGESGSEDLLTMIAEFLASYGVDAADPLQSGLIGTLGGAVGSAGRIRDRFSVDGWAALADLDKSMRRMAARLQPGDDSAAAMGVFLRKIAGFSGLVHENMYRTTSWRFLTIGRSLERAAIMADVLAVFADNDAASGSLDLAIEVGDSIMTHRQRYAVTASRDSAIDLMALDTENPRSILFHLSEIRKQGESLEAGQMSGFLRAVRAVETRVAILTPQPLDTFALRDIRAEILSLSAALSNAYLH
jgi:uncharacterized circularly permuted ATP-grasp superfamily protein/uncharacterized alpha-E superfamily protein